VSAVLLQALAAGDTVRGLAAVTTDVVEEARRRHGTLPTATAALGRTLTAGLLLGATMKDDEKLSIELAGDGPLGRIQVDTEGGGRVRGYVAHPATHLPPKHGKLDVAGALGSGLLCVIRTKPWEKEPYRSIMPLVSGEIAQDIAHYLVASEQMPSAVALGVFVAGDGRTTAAGGYLVQALNGAGAAVVARMEANVARMPAVTTLIREGAAPLDILERALAGLGLGTPTEQPVAFGCRCTRERVFGALILLGADEIRDIIATEGAAEVTCAFCAEHYVVGAEELEMLIAEPAGSA